MLSQNLINLQTLNKGKNLGTYNVKITRYKKRDFWVTDKNGDEILNTFDVVEVLEMEEKTLTTNLISQNKALKNTCTDEVKIVENQHLANLRAKTRIKKLINENGLGYHICTTYAKEEENRNNQIKDNIKFLKRLSYKLGQKVLYVAVPEIQPKRFKKTGARVYHMHIAIPLRIEIRELWSAWNNKRCLKCDLYTDKKKDFKCGECKYFKGVVFIKRQGEFDLIKNANYFGKYFSKGFEEKDLNQRKFGQKRYFCSTGLEFPNEEYLYISPEKIEEIKSWSKDKACSNWQQDFDNDNYNGIKSFNRLQGFIFDAIIENKFK